MEGRTKGLNDKNAILKESKKHSEKSQPINESRQKNEFRLDMFWGSRI